MQIIRSKAEMIATTKAWQAAGETVCLVPTMGGIHAGHLALIATARATATRSVVSIYVNPTQFAAGEDFDSYPRNFDADCAAITQAGGCDAIYAPVNMYEDDDTTTIHPANAAKVMEGVNRPHFFIGVATIVYKLFTHVSAEFAIFGEKDFQQLLVIREMVRDYNLPIRIIDHPTIRERDGLAMASRNQYLTPDKRKTAPQLYGEMRRAGDAIMANMPVNEALDAARENLQNAGFGKIDYFDLRQPDDLQASLDAAPENRIFVAIWLGSTRLIDNCTLA